MMLVQPRNAKHSTGPDRELLPTLFFSFKLFSHSFCFVLLVVFLLLLFFCFLQVQHVGIVEMCIDICKGNGNVLEGVRLLQSVQSGMRWLMVTMWLPLCISCNPFFFPLCRWQDLLWSISWGRQSHINKVLLPFCLLHMRRANCESLSILFSETGPRVTESANGFRPDKCFNFLFSVTIHALSLSTRILCARTAQYILICAWMKSNLRRFEDVCSPRRPVPSSRPPRPASGSPPGWHEHTPSPAPLCKTATKEGSQFLLTCEDNV